MINASSWILIRSNVSSPAARASRPRLSAGRKLVPGFGANCFCNAAAYRRDNPFAVSLDLGAMSDDFSQLQTSFVCPVHDTCREPDEVLLPSEPEVSMPICPNGTNNWLLDRSPEEEFKRLAPLLEPVSLAEQQDLYDVDDVISHVYFPQTGMISMVTLLENGRQVESGTIGREGVVGLFVVLGVGFSTHRVMCQVASKSLRAPVAPFMEALKASTQLYSLLKRYAVVSLRNTSQIVACNVLHPVLERMCRWLLMIHDRAEMKEFRITQEFLAEMLGVRRQTISIIAGTLQKADLITYRRGAVQILNRKGLEAGACECYEVMRTTYDRIIG